MKSIIPRCICRREEEEIIMAKFCTKCGRPLPENGICPCTLQQPVNPEAPQAQAEPQYRIPQQPQYQAPQYQAPQHQTAAPVQTPPAPKEPSAFGKAITDLPKKFLRFIKNPIATIQASVEKKDLMGGIVGMAVSVIACFLATLVYALRWGFGFAAWAWIVVGMFAPVVACGFTLLGYFVMSKLGKVEADFKGLLAAVGTGALLPAALTLTSMLLLLISTWFFNAFGILIIAVWVVTAFLTVFHVYGVKPTALNLLVFIGFCFVAYTAVAEMRDWFVNSVWSYTSALEDYFSGWY